MSYFRLHYISFDVLFDPTSEFIDPFCCTLFLYHLYWKDENVRLLLLLLFVKMLLVLCGVNEEYELDNKNPDDAKLSVAGLWHSNIFNTCCCCVSRCCCWDDLTNCSSLLSTSNSPLPPINIMPWQRFWIFVLDNSFYYCFYWLLILITISLSISLLTIYDYISRDWRVGWCFYRFYYLCYFYSWL